MSRKDGEKMIREDWFKDHKVLEHSFFGDGPHKVETMIWGKEGTGIYRVYYVCRHSVLMVYGDIGDAIYQWHGNPPVDLQWISGCSLDYFHGKCQASENGRSSENYDWDEKEARNSVFEYFKERKDCRGYKAFRGSTFNEAIESKQSFQAALHTDHAYDIFADDWWEWLPGCGNVIPIRTAGHLIGLKMAFPKGRP